VANDEFVLFHRIDDPASAAVRREIVARGLKSRIDFQNVDSADGKLMFAARGGATIPAIWDGAGLRSGADAVLSWLSEVENDGGEVMNEHIEKVEQSSSGLDANAAGALCYIFWFFSGILFLATEKKSRFVRFHAMQSTLAFLGLFLIQFLLSKLGPLAALNPLVWLTSLGVWALMIYKAYSWQAYRLPWVGDAAAKELERPVAG
jgi:uncharacterized membrane protein